MLIKVVFQKDMFSKDLMGSIWRFFYTIFSRTLSGFSKNLQFIFVDFPKNIYQRYFRPIKYDFLRMFSQGHIMVIELLLLNIHDVTLRLQKKNNFFCCNGS